MERQPATSNDGKGEARFMNMPDMAQAIPGETLRTFMAGPEENPMLESLAEPQDDGLVYDQLLVNPGIGEDCIRIGVPNARGMSEQAERIMADLLGPWVRKFLEKNADYTSEDGFNTADLLAERGQFAELWRKMGKLKVALWDGQPMNFEGEVEILEDMIGHCFLAIDYIRNNS